MTNITLNNYVFDLLLFSDEIQDLKVYQTNLYALQLKIKTGKNYASTNKKEIMTILGMNILMEIKRSPSYRNYWCNKYYK